MRSIVALGIAGLSGVVLVVGLLFGIQRKRAEAPPLPPLVQAVRNGDREALRILVELGVDANDQRGGRGWTPLMHAIHTGNVAMVEALIDAGAQANHPSGSGLTPIAMAAAYGRNDIVRLLLARGADPAQANNQGLTALDFAMLGANDIDRFTLLECQHETVALLKQHAPELQPRGGLVDRILLFVKPCRYTSEP